MTKTDTIAKDSIIKTEAATGLGILYLTILSAIGSRK